MSAERSEQRKRAKSLAPVMAIANAIMIAFFCWMGGDDLPFALAVVVSLSVIEAGIFAWVHLRK
jgi:hypothetical protein